MAQKVYVAGRGGERVERGRENGRGRKKDVSIIAAFILEIFA